MKDTLKKLVDDALARALEQQAEQMITMAILQPLQRTSEWGEPIGQPTSLMARLEEELRAHFHEPVDRDGNTERSTYRRNECPSRLEWMVQQYAIKECEKKAAEVIKQVGEEARVKVAESLAVLLTEKLAPRIRT